MKKVVLFFVIQIFSAVTVLAQNQTIIHEKIILELCSQPGPVLVIDNFQSDLITANRPSIDVDGNGSFDVFHGEFVEKILYVNGHESTRLNVGPQTELDELSDKFSAIIEKVESGEMKTSWINFSQGFPLKISRIARTLKNRSVAYKNIHLFAEDYLNSSSHSASIRKSINRLRSLFLRFKEKSIKIVSTAHNNGYQEVNLFSLFPNVITVGALDEKGRVAPYSGNNSLVTIWRTGDIKTSKTPGGVDINQDQKIDFTGNVEMVSPQVIAEVNGKFVGDVIQYLPEAVDRENDDNKNTFFKLLKKLPQGVYDTRYLLKKTLATSFDLKNHLLDLGSYFYLSADSQLPLFFFNTGSSGEIKINHESFGEVWQRGGVVKGTSFAAPNICNGQSTPTQLHVKWQIGE